MSEIKDGKSGMGNKAGNIVLGILGVILFAILIMMAVERETSWPFLVMAVLVCPVTGWIFQKKFGGQYPVRVWLARCGILVVGFFAMIYLNYMFHFHRTYTFINDERVMEAFNKLVDSGNVEGGEVSSIKETEYGDYSKLTATVGYVDKQSGKQMQQEVALYFDRIMGNYFDTFDEMRVWRKENRDGIVFKTSHFEEERLNRQIDEIIKYVTEDEYGTFCQLLSDEQKVVITEQKWKDWQQELSSLGEYRRKKEISADVRMGEGDSDDQEMAVDIKLWFATGTEGVKVRINEEMKITEFEM